MENLDTDLVRMKTVGDNKGNRLSEINLRLKKTLQMNKLMKFFSSSVSVFQMTILGEQDLYSFNQTFTKMT